MANVTEIELAAELAEVQAQVAALLARLERLETEKSVASKQNAAAVVEHPNVDPAAKPAADADPAKTGITQEEVIAISAALAAYLGVRVHIKQIRLLSSHAWAQEGRVSIQASHRLHS